MADEYEQARRPETETLASSTPKPNRVSSRECQYCGKSGHAEEDCYKRKREESQRSRGAYYKAVHTKEVWEPGGTYKGSLGTRGYILRKSGNQGVHTKEVWEHTKEVCEPGGAYKSYKEVWEPDGGVVHSSAFFWSPLDTLNALWDLMNLISIECFTYVAVRLYRSQTIPSAGGYG